jgi:hypothetical protein
MVQHFIFDAVLAIYLLVMIELPCLDSRFKVLNTGCFWRKS